MIRTDSNRIIFEGNLSSGSKSAIACLFNLVNKQGYTDVVLDFSSTTYVDASFMLPILSYVEYYRLNGTDLQYVSPADTRLSRLFSNANWAHFLDPFNHECNFGRRLNNLPVVKFVDGDAQHDAVNRAMEILMETIKVADRKQLKALEWALNEITDNVLNHAESPIGGFVQIQSFPLRKRVSFNVVDAGLGIPQTLRHALPKLTSDAEALDRAIREGVTRDKISNQGNGLFGTFKCCEVSRGQFYIRSNSAVLEYGAKGLRVANDSVPFRGTYICATINYDTENSAREGPGLSRTYPRTRI